MTVRSMLATLLLLLSACAAALAQRPELVVQTGDPDGPNVAAFSPDGRLSPLRARSGSGRRRRVGSCATLTLGRVVLPSVSTARLCWPQPAQQCCSGMC